MMELKRSIPSCQGGLLFYQSEALLECLFSFYFLCFFLIFYLKKKKFKKEKVYHIQILCNLLKTWKNEYGSGWDESKSKTNFQNFES